MRNSYFDLLLAYFKTAVYMAKLGEILKKKAHKITVAQLAAKTEGKPEAEPGRGPRVT